MTGQCIGSVIRLRVLTSGAACRTPQQLWTERGIGRGKGVLYSLRFPPEVKTKVNYFLVSVNIFMTKPRLVWVPESNLAAFFQAEHALRLSTLIKTAIALGKGGGEMRPDTKTKFDTKIASRRRVARRVIPGGRGNEDVSQPSPPVRRESHVRSVLSRLSALRRWERSPDLN
uniref:Uncharacterized protein n=1 Tax=Bursaphelenchus xylophilus TaxID=6326 RepID=A0A1I7ST96_BURXY